jgi:hypothetical protein
MPKSVAIIQSNYIPWKGYFDMIGMVDEFVIYDEVQYTKNDWRNRNRIKAQSGTQWITIPVYQKSLNQKVSESLISDAKWAHKHWNTLVTNYSKAAHFKSVSSFFEEFYKRDQPDLLSEVNTALIQLICDYLDIKTKISNSSDYQLTGDPTEKLVSLCKQIGATTYLTGPAAKNYLQESLFNQESISVQWMDYSNYPEYPQLHPPFEHAVSILDLLFHTGQEASHYMKFSKK